MNERYLLEKLKSNLAERVRCSRDCAQGVRERDWMFFIRMKARAIALWRRASFLRSQDWRSSKLGGDTRESSTATWKGDLALLWEVPE